MCADCKPHYERTFESRCRGCNENYSELHRELKSWDFLPVVGSIETFENDCVSIKLITERSNISLHTLVGGKCEQDILPTMHPTHRGFYPGGPELTVTGLVMNVYWAL